jgi:YihY family inner membrane protein
MEVDARAARGAPPRVTTTPASTTNPIERVIRAVDRYQQRQRWLGLIYGVIKKFGDDNAGVLVSNLAYSAFIAVFPLLLVLVTVLGLVLGSDAGARDAVLHSTLKEFPVIGTQLGQNIHALKQRSILGLTIGLVGLIWGSTGLAQAGLFAMEQIWNIPGAGRPNFWSRLGRSLAFLAALSLGVITSTFLASFGTFGHNDPGFGVLSEILAFILNVGQYFVAFRVLTPRSVPSRALWPGVVLGALVWTGLQAVGGFVVGHYLRNNSAVYGTFGIVLGLVAWLYLAVRITVYAAELNVVLARRLWPRSIVQPPLTEADERVLAAQAMQNQRRPEQTVSVTFARDEPEGYS